MLDLVTRQPVRIGRRRAEPVAKPRNLEMCLFDRLAVLAAEQSRPLVDIFLTGFQIVRNLIQLCGPFGIACPGP